MNLLGLKSFLIYLKQLVSCDQREFLQLMVFTRMSFEERDIFVTQLHTILCQVNQRRQQFDS